MTKTIILATGGTGGHIFPAKAVAKKLIQQGLRVIIFGDQNYKKYHKAGSSYQARIISSSQFNKSPVALLKAGLKIGWGVLQSLFWILKYQPQTLVAFGGYSTFPVLIAAVILRKRIILHEQNAHLGKVNRIFAKFANKIALSYQETSGCAQHRAREGGCASDSENRARETQSSLLFRREGGCAQHRAREVRKFYLTGNPIREEILALSQKEYELPDFNKPKIPVENLGYNVLLASQFRRNETGCETFNILVIGGSGGAKIFSEILPRAIFNLRENLKDQLLINQQCRLENLPATFEQYKTFNINIEIDHFFENMAEEIAKAHLVIARSGSSSLAELTCAKRPMILVPFALAADNHQEKNALEIEKSGGAIVIKEKDFTISNLTRTLEKLIDNPAMLKKMSTAAFKCANLNAAENLIAIINNKND